MGENRHDLEKIDTARGGVLLERIDTAKSKCVGVDTAGERLWERIDTAEARVRERIDIAAAR